MPTTVLSPPPLHEQPTAQLPAGHLASSPRSHGESAFLGGPGRRSVLPPLTRSRSPLAARPSSPRHHSSSTITITNQPLPSASNTMCSPPSRRYDRSINDSRAEVPEFGFWDDDTVSDNNVITSWQNPYDQYFGGGNEEDVDLDLQPFNHRPAHIPSTTTYDFDAPSARPSPPPTLPPLAGPSRSETQLTTTTWNDSLMTQLTDDLFADDAFPDSSQTSFSESMPATRKRNAPATENSHNAKRPRTSGSGIDVDQVVRQDSFAKQNPTATTDLDFDNLFGESPRDVNYIDDESVPEDLPTIDLTEANEVLEELKKLEEDKRIKISAFQCVICMDDVTTLTVTHCGHLYCAQCLHSSLHVEATKGKCPMCRSKIDIKPRSSYTTKTKGFWPLELKLMTTTRKGKRKANPTT